MDLAWMYVRYFRGLAVLISQLVTPLYKIEYLGCSRGERGLGRSRESCLLVGQVSCSCL
jgi:hypothetical protein